MNMYSEQLKAIMSLIIENAPQVKLATEIKGLQEQISINIKESQRISNLLDGIADQYISHSNTHAQQVVSLKPSTFVSGDEKERISEIANRLVKDGIVNTQDIIPELRKFGNQKEQRYLLVSIGNILHQRGWRKIGTGKYVNPDTQKLLDVK